MTQITFSEYDAKGRSIYDRPEVGQTIKTWAPKTDTFMVVKKRVTETDYYPVTAVVTKVTDNYFSARVIESQSDNMPVGTNFSTKVVKSNVIRPGYRNGKSTCHWEIVS